MSSIDSEYRMKQVSSHSRVVTLPRDLRATRARKVKVAYGDLRMDTSANIHVETLTRKQIVLNVSSNGRCTAWGVTRPTLSNRFDVNCSLVSLLHLPENSNYIRDPFPSIKNPTSQRFDLTSLLTRIYRQEMVNLFCQQLPFEFRAKIPQFLPYWPDKIEPFVRGIRIVFFRLIYKCNIHFFIHRSSLNSSPRCIYINERLETSAMWFRIHNRILFFNVPKWWCNKDEFRSSLFPEGPWTRCSQSDARRELSRSLRWASERAAVTSIASVEPARI